MQVLQQLFDHITYVAMHERKQAQAGDEHQRALGELEHRDDAQLCAEPSAEIPVACACWRLRIDLAPAYRFAAQHGDLADSRRPMM